MEEFPVWIGGDICYIPDTKEAKRKLVKKYGETILEDYLSWNLAYMLNKGLIKMYNKDGEDITYLALKAISNTLKLLGLTWKDVPWLAKM